MSIEVRKVYKSLSDKPWLAYESGEREFLFSITSNAVFNIIEQGRALRDMHALMTKYRVKHYLDYVWLNSAPDEFKTWYAQWSKAADCLDLASDVFEFDVESAAIRMARVLDKYERSYAKHGYNYDSYYSFDEKRLFLFFAPQTEPSKSLRAIREKAYYKWYDKHPDISYGIYRKATDYCEKAGEAA